MPDRRESSSDRVRAQENYRNDSPEADRVESVIEEAKEGGRTRHGIYDLIHHWAWITIFSILGTLTRLGIQSLNTYSGQLIPHLVWAQFIGCAVMGFLASDTTLFPKENRYDALYLGLTVGYCGSTTSFSAWILAAYEDLANTEGFARPRGYNVISIITEIMITLSASIVAFKLGSHAAQLLARSSVKQIKNPDSILLIMGLASIAICFQASAIIVTGVRRDWRGIVGFAMIFSPAGALTRWYLSKWFNRRIPSFPLGTFGANMIGVVLESIFHLLQYHAPSGNSCSILQGLQDGYCGALTTVSTFTSELFALKRQHAYRYATVSIVVGVVIYVVVDGIDYWTHGSSGYHARCSFETP